MKLTKNQLKRIIKEAKRQILKEYGNTLGKVTWYEDDIEEVLFDVEGYGDRLTQDAVWDIANDAGDDEITADIQAAVEDWEDYMYSS
jgi:Mg2+/Co2+ transporter CorB